MAQVINTNSLSLITQNNINKNQSALSTSIERLSSGLRINSAKDDAAGQAIANRFTSNIKGLTQAARNANDGISLAQTTEGALSEINNNLQRVRELTVQATTGTNSDSDLSSIQDEIKSRLDEIDRVSGQTQFNGVNVLAKDGTMKIQVGANDGETITIDLQKIDSSTLKLTGFNVNGAGSVNNTKATIDDLGSYTKGTVTNGVTAYDKVATNKAATSAQILAQVGTTAGNKVTYTGTDTGLGVAADTNTYTYNSTTKSYNFGATGVAAADALNYLNPTNGSTTSATVSIGSNTQGVSIDKTGNITAADDGAVLYLDTSGNLTKTNDGSLNQATLSRLMVNADAAGTPNPIATSIVTDKGTLSSTGGATATFKITNASISQSAFNNIIQSGSYTATIGAQSYAVTTGASTTAFISGTDGSLTNAATYTTDTVYLQENGNVTKGSGDLVYKSADGKLTTDAATKADTTPDPLKALDASISQIDKFRSSLGAVQNRLDSAVTNLNNTTTNLSEAQSRIQDADYATEVSNMSKAQIIQQAGNSVLAKANQVPQQVLSLLQG